MKFKATLLLFSLLIVSCKEQSNKAKKETVEAVPLKKELIIDFNFKTDVEDQFAILINDIKIDEFQSKSVSIKETVYPSTGLENIHAKFDPNNLSNVLLITFGRTLKNVFFENLKFQYGNNIIVIDKNNFDDYMTANKYLEYNKESSIFTAVEENGYTDPVIFAKQNLIDFLSKE